MQPKKIANYTNQLKKIFYSWIFVINKVENKTKPDKSGK